MIFAPLAYSLHTFDPFSYLLEASESAPTAMDSGEVRLRSVGGADKKTVDELYTVQFRRPAQAQVMIANGKTGKSMKEIIVSSGLRTIIDRGAGQRTETPVENGADLRKSVFYGQMTLDELVLSVFDPPTLKKYYDDNFRKRTGFKVVREGGQWWIKASYTGGSISAAFQDGDAKISKLRLKSKGGYWNWDLTYSRLPGTADFEATGKTYLVKSFDSRLRPPTCTSAAATAAMEKVLTAYDGLHSLGVTVRSAGKATKLMLSGSQIRQTDDESDFSYDGDNLTIIKNDTKTIFNGHAKPSEVLEMLGKLKIRVDPTMMPLLQQKNPFREMLSNAKVTLENTMMVGQEKVWMFTALTWGWKYVISARASDGKVISLSAVPIQKTGLYVSEQKQFEYLAKDELNDRAFVVDIPSGYRQESTQKLIAQN